MGFRRLRIWPRSASRVARNASSPGSRPVCSWATGARTAATLRVPETLDEQMFPHSGRGGEEAYGHGNGGLLDRLTHHGHIFEMNGESDRLRESMKREKSRKSQ